MNHKTILVTAFLISFGLSAFSENSNDVERLRVTVDAAAQYAKSKPCRQASVIVDNLIVLHVRPEFQALQEALKDDWPIAISNLNEIAKDDIEKTIVLCSTWYVSEEDFVAVLDEVANLVEKGELDRDIFRWCQSPFESPLDHFLIRNYKDPRVQDILIRTRAIFSDQPERVATYDRILSGKSLKWLEKYEADMQEGWGFAIRRKLVSPFRNLVTPATSEDGNVSGSKRWFTLPVVAGVIAGLICTSIWILRRRR